MKITCVILFTVLVWLTACNKTDNHPGSLYLPVTITFLQGNDAPVNITVDYDNQQRISVVRIPDGSHTYVYAFNYNPDNTVQSYQFDGQTYQMNYAGGQLSQITGEHTTVAVSYASGVYTVDGMDYHFDGNGNITQLLNTVEIGYGSGKGPFYDAHINPTVIIAMRQLLVFAYYLGKNEITRYTTDSGASEYTISTNKDNNGFLSATGWNGTGAGDYDLTFNFGYSAY